MAKHFLPFLLAWLSACTRESLGVNGGSNVHTLASIAPTEPASKGRGRGRTPASKKADRIRCQKNKKKPIQKSTAKSQAEPAKKSTFNPARRCNAIKRQKSGGDPQHDVTLAQTESGPKFVDTKKKSNKKLRLIEHTCEGKKGSLSATTQAKLGGESDNNLARARRIAELQAALNKASKAAKDKKFTDTAAKRIEEERGVDDLGAEDERILDEFWAKEQRRLEELQAKEQLEKYRPLQALDEHLQTNEQLLQKQDMQIRAAHAKKED